MIGYVRGTVAHKGEDSMIIDVGGVGYVLLVSRTTLTGSPQIGSEAKLFTHLHVREDLMQMFGFATEAEKSMFERLISVDKIGPKLAVAILSAFPVSALQQAIMFSDVEMLTSISGIGKKGAQRIILELREKMELADFDFEPLSVDGKPDERLADVREALKSLGYGSAEIARALSLMEITAQTSTESFIKAALKELSR